MPKPVEISRRLDRSPVYIPGLISLTALRSSKSGSTNILSLTSYTQTKFGLLNGKIEIRSNDPSREVVFTPNYDPQEI